MSTAKLIVSFIVGAIVAALWQRYAAPTIISQWAADLGWLPVGFVSGGFCALVLMSGKKTVAQIMLVLALGMLVLLSCTRGGSVSPDDATATYGAEQFHLQLTAQAQK